MDSKFITLVMINLISISFGFKCFMEGECTDSFVISTNTQESYKACLDLAKEFEEAHWITFDQDNKNCQLFSNCTNLSNEYCQNCTTSEVTCSEEPICEVYGIGIVRNY